MRPEDNDIIMDNDISTTHCILEFKCNPVGYMLSLCAFGRQVKTWSDCKAVALKLNVFSRGMENEEAVPEPTVKNPHHFPRYDGSFKEVSWF